MAVPAQAYAFNIQISAWQIWAMGLMIAGPGILLSARLLRRAIVRTYWFALVFFLWVVLMPLAALLVINLLTPDVMARTHAYSAWQLLLRIWLVGSLVPLVPAWGWWWAASRQRNRN